jgi:hypothetical protein
MRLLLGLARPTAGEALIFGRPYRQLGRPATRVGAVLESNDFDPDARDATTCVRSHWPRRSATPALTRFSS